MQAIDKRGPWSHTTFRRYVIWYRIAFAAPILFGAAFWGLWTIGPTIGPSFKLWIIATSVWAFCATILTCAWILHRRYHHEEDIIWWCPPIVRGQLFWNWPASVVAASILGAGTAVVGGLVFPIVALAIMLGGPILIERKRRLLYRNLRETREPACWNCLYNVRHIHPDSDACPECGFPVSESISRWKVCPKAFRPKWVAEGEGREESALS